MGETNSGLWTYKYTLKTKRTANLFWILLRKFVSGSSTGIFSEFFCDYCRIEQMIILILKIMEIRAFAAAKQMCKYKMGHGHIELCAAGLKLEESL